MTTTTRTTTISESVARRAARRAGLVALKSRWRKYSPDNFGDFMLIEPETGIPVAGWKYDLTAQEVVDYCRG